MHCGRQRTLGLLVRYSYWNVDVNAFNANFVSRGTGARAENAGPKSEVSLETVEMSPHSMSHRPLQRK